jgi:hypothetical protein
MKQLKMFYLLNKYNYRGLISENVSKYEEWYNIVLLKTNNFNLRNGLYHIQRDWIE